MILFPLKTASIPAFMHCIRHKIPTLTAFDFSARFPEFSSVTTPVFYSLSNEAAI
jgi:hypothetical protein